MQKAKPLAQVKRLWPIMSVILTPPVISSVAISTTLYGDGITAGMPKGAFGAMFLDWEGNLYFGLNRGDHDLEDGTDATGGIHCVDLDWNEGTAYAEFMAEPKATTH